MTIFLHIGMQKTGTTSLQRAMGNAREALKERGVFYPSSTFGLDVEDRSPDHHYLAHALRGQRTSYTPDAPFEVVKNHCAAISDAAEQSPDVTVLSSEDFSLLGRPAIKRLRRILKGDVKVLVYLRRQDYWADSLYGHSLKIGRRHDLKKFLDNNYNRMDYRSYLKRWEEAFGRENIVVRTYEGKTQEDLWPDFCEAIGRPYAVSAIPGTRRDNRSLTKRQTEIIANIDDKEDRQELRKKFETKNSAAKSITEYQFIARSEAQSLLARCQDENREVAQDFLGRDDLFLDMELPPAPKPPKVVRLRIVNLVARMLGVQEYATDGS